MRDSSLGPLLAVFARVSGWLQREPANMALVAIMGDFSSMPWRRSGSAVYMIAVTVVVTCMAHLYRRLPMRTLFSRRRL
ncbi:MAG: hypothetical protein ACLSGS_08185 [Adlercreutzia sp.]